MAIETDEAQGLSLGDYFRVVWRRKWIILALAIICAVVGYARADRQTRYYRSAAQIMYENPVDISNPLADGGAIDPNARTMELETVGNVINGPEVQEIADGMLSTAGEHISYGVYAELHMGTTAGSDLYGSVVDIVAESTNPEAAALAANTYAKAYIQWRKEREQERVDQAIKVVQAEINKYTTPASRQLADYVNLKQRLQDLQILRETATGNFRVIVPAYPSSVPFSPQPRRSAMVGGAVGLFLGIVIAFVLEQFDTRLRSHREVAGMLGLPIVGRVPEVSNAALQSGALVATTEPGSGVSEALRVVRANLDFLNSDGSLRAILVTSSLEGEGKTLTVANLAVTLAMAGKNVVVIDADMRHARVHKAFNLPNNVGLSTVLEGKMKLVDALKPYISPAVATGAGSNGRRPAGEGTGIGKGVTRLYVLTGGPVPPNPGELVATRRFEAVLAELRDSVVDYILIDSPAFLAVGDAAALAASVDGLLLIVSMENVRKPVLEEAREFLDPLPCRKLGIITVRDKVRTSRYSHYVQPTQASAKS